MRRSTNVIDVIVSNLSGDTDTGLFLLFGKKNWGGARLPGPSPCYGTVNNLSIIK